jgi:hypothetical protein
MRIVVSGTHASGKSTLISDFHAARPEYLVLSDPFDDLDLDDEHPSGERSFARQLRLTAARLQESTDRPSAISERGPLDFLAYLTALERLGRSDGALLARATEIVDSSLAAIDLIAIVPLDERRPIHVEDEEDPALRRAMDEALWELVDDLERTGVAPRVVTIAGSPETRLQLLIEASRG